MLRRKIGEIFIKYRVRSSRGGVFTSEIQGILNAAVQGGVIISVVHLYSNYLLPLWVVPLLWLAQKSFEYFMGLIDEKHLGWWAQENNFIIANTNPFLVNMDKKIDDISRRLKEYETTTSTHNGPETKE